MGPNVRFVAHYSHTDGGTIMATKKEKKTPVEEATPEKKRQADEALEWVDANYPQFTDDVLDRVTDFVNELRYDQQVTEWHTKPGA